MKRKFYETLLEWKDKNIEMPLMLVGARQIGKTYIVREFCKNEFENFIEINLDLEEDVKEIFEKTINPEEIIKKLELHLDRKIEIENTVIFFDEIQVSERAITSLKYFCESKISYKIICAGSLLGVKLHRFHSSFPVGKVRIEFMYPMDFEEFLLALNKQMWLDEIKRCYNNLEPISIHEQLLDLYRRYLCIGGMPDAINKYKEVNQDILLWDKLVISNIILSYLADMNKYTINSTEAVKIEKVYKAVPNNLGREKGTDVKKFKYSTIEQGAKRRDFESAIDWLLASNMVHKCTIVNKVEIPLKVFSQENIFKLYLNDTALLTSLLEIKFADILLDKEFMYKGSIAENYVAQSFICNNISLYYWSSGNKAEIDFLLYNQNGIIPVEVKAGENTKAKSLNTYIEKYKPKYAIRISSKNFGFENNIKSIPLYATFCIK